MERIPEKKKVNVVIGVHFDSRKEGKLIRGDWKGKLEEKDREISRKLKRRWRKETKGFPMKNVEIMELANKEGAKTFLIPFFSENPPILREFSEERRPGLLIGGNLEIAGKLRRKLEGEGLEPSSIILSGSLRDMCVRRVAEFLREEYKDKPIYLLRRPYSHLSAPPLESTKIEEGRKSGGYLKFLKDSNVREIDENEFLEILGSMISLSPSEKKEMSAKLGEFKKHIDEYREAVKENERIIKKRDENARELLDSWEGTGFGELKSILATHNRREIFNSQFQFDLLGSLIAILRNAKPSKLLDGETRKSFIVILDKAIEFMEKDSMGIEDRAHRSIHGLAFKEKAKGILDESVSRQRTRKEKDMNNSLKTSLDRLGRYAKKDLSDFEERCSQARRAISTLEEVHELINDLLDKAGEKRE